MDVVTIQAVIRASLIIYNSLVPRPSHSFNVLRVTLKIWVGLKMKLYIYFSHTCTPTVATRHCTCLFLSLMLMEWLWSWSDWISELILPRSFWNLLSIPSICYKYVCKCGREITNVQITLYK